MRMVAVYLAVLAVVFAGAFAIGAAAGPAGDKTPVQEVHDDSHS
jgi:hypothetical protein